MLLQELKLSPAPPPLSPETYNCVRAISSRGPYKWGDMRESTPLMTANTTTIRFYSCPRDWKEGAKFRPPSPDTFFQTPQISLYCIQGFKGVLQGGRGERCEPLGVTFPSSPGPPFLIGPQKHHG